MNATQTFDATLEWLREHYQQFRFYTERDVVWTIQLHIMQRLSAQGQLTVFNDYAIVPGARRSLCTDLAIVMGSNAIELAVEFKYEPSHNRTDINPKKFPVCFWGMEGVAKDIERARRFVSDGRSKASRAILIDEGNHFRHRTPHLDSQWEDWYSDGPSVLVARFDS